MIYLGKFGGKGTCFYGNKNAEAPGVSVTWLTCTHRSLAFSQIIFYLVWCSSRMSFSLSSSVPLAGHCWVSSYSFQLVLLWVFFGRLTLCSSVLNMIMTSWFDFFCEGHFSKCNVTFLGFAHPAVWDDPGYVKVHECSLVFLHNESCCAFWGRYPGLCCVVAWDLT